MSKLEIIKFIETDRWNKIVKSFPDWQVYYLNSYVSGFNIHGDGEPILVSYSNKDGKLAFVTMKRDISKVPGLEILQPNKYFDLSTPYGYGGPLIVTDNIEVLINNFNKEFINYCNNENIVSEFIRFSPFINNHIGMNDYCELIHLGSTVEMTLQSEDTMWNNMQGTCRNRIRKAEKNNIVIHHEYTQEAFKNFTKLYNETMDRDSATNYYYFKEDFYQDMYHRLKDNAEIFYAEYEGKIIASCIILYNPNGAHYHLGASKTEFMNLAPTNLIFYNVAKWSIEKGIPFYHLGGGLGAQDDNLLRFKKTFNKTKLLDFYIGKKVINKDVYKKLVELKTGNSFMNESNFFPLYRK